MNMAHAGVAAAALEKMAQAGASPLAMRVFQDYAAQISSGATGLITEDSIEPLTSAVDAQSLEFSHEAQRTALDQTVLLKLNGGLGTSMGMDHAKSLLPVREGQTFLDLISGQIRAARTRYGARLPLILMNSFRTREDSLAALPQDIPLPDLPIDIVQGKEPKLLVDSLEPVSWPADPALEWCPPGHGDVYTTLADTGLVDALLAQGYRYMFASNSDNLGATPSGDLAAWFAASGAPFALEVCERTAADRKGGHLARRKSDGRVILREKAQTAVEDEAYFADEHRHRYFNTNNLWFNLEALRDLLERTGGLVQLPLILNRKHVDPADPTSPEVYQVECAIGAIVDKFDGAQAVLVPRSRFLPVKTTNDLLLIRSDAYRVNDAYEFEQTEAQLPLIDLDPRYFAMIADFNERFAQIPSLRGVTRLRVVGDLRFSGELAFSGDVELAGTGSVAAAS